MKPIRLTTHATGYLVRRGFSVEEVEEAIRTAAWKPADLGRLECEMEFVFNREWNGRRYAQKLIRPIFVEELREIVVVTVYVLYY
jgi:hypothetical protein